VGLIQRTIEAEGIATISISLSREITKTVLPPRALFVGFPLGHPIAFPGQIFRQRQILRLLLKYLKNIDSPGTIVELNLTGGVDSSVTCTTCAVD
jgi:D-proline reductase (dithiol) PrdB